MKAINSAIVGQKFHAGAHDKLLATLPGSEVTLVREPENRFDKNAIRCEIDGVMCGYVPKEQAKRLAKDMDAGRSVSAALYEYNKLTIEIAEVKDEPFHDDEIPDLAPDAPEEKKGDDLIDEFEL